MNYDSFINAEQYIVDNAGLMCMNLLKKLGVRSLLLAGFDGFGDNQRENYYDAALGMDVEAERLHRMNIATAAKISQLKTQMEIRFLTQSVYDRGEKR